MLSLYRRHLKTCPNAGDRFVRKGDKCPVWVEGVDPRGLYHRKSLRTGSWDIGGRLMRDMMVPAAPDAPADAARPESAPPMSLESAISTFIANLEGENRAADTIRKYRLMFRELQGFADRHRLSTVAELNFEKLVAFRKTWTQQGAQTRNKQLDRLKDFFQPATTLDGSRRTRRGRSSRRALHTSCRPHLLRTSRSGF